MSRVIWIVLDSVGMGEAPDAGSFGDNGANTIGHIAQKYPELYIPNLLSLGYGNIDGMEGLKRVDSPLASYARLEEISAGKDTTTGHWEMIGIHTLEPFPVYPEGFSDEIISKFIEKTSVPGVLCNSIASGTVVINQYGNLHRETKKPIIYTSADSVFQIACDEEIYDINSLYKMCEAAREILTGKDNVARVIARPFIKKGDSFVRTSSRRDFSRLPDDDNLLMRLKNHGQNVYAVGKIEDIFAGSGITQAIHTKDNEDGMDKTIEALRKQASGLIFTNLVEFDSTWGHRRDALGYAKGLEAFDKRLGELLSKMGKYKDSPSDDYLIITADHGCDPTFKGTDHTREYVPLIIYGNNIKKGINLHTLKSFACIGQSVLKLLLPEDNIKPLQIGESFLEDVIIK